MFPTLQPNRLYVVDLKTVLKTCSQTSGSISWQIDDIKRISRLEDSSIITIFLGIVDVRSSERNFLTSLLFALPDAGGFANSADLLYPRVGDYGKLHTLASVASLVLATKMATARSRENFSTSSRTPTTCQWFWWSWLFSWRFCIQEEFSSDRLTTLRPLSRLRLWSLTI